MTSQSTTDDKRPRCPKCGEPARVVIVKLAKARCVLNMDGSAGEVLTASRDKTKQAAFECGGGHVWEKKDGTK